MDRILKVRSLIAAAILVVLLGTTIAFAATSGTFEAAKQSSAGAQQQVVAWEAKLSSDRQGVVTDESNLAAAKTHAAQAKTVVTDIEAEGTEKPKEEPPKEEPPAGASVNATPLGPAAPSGGWKVAYADAFGVEVGTGTGQDPTWTKENGPNCCTNSNEIAAVRPSNATVTANGLRLLMEHANYEGKSYVGAYIRGNAPRSPQISFKGETLAIQWAGTLPPNKGFADPAAWMDGAGGSAEFDFPEFIGWSSRYTGSWSGLFGYFAWFFSPHPEGVNPNIGTLEGAQHTYALLIRPASAGKYRYSLYIDGNPFALSYAPCYTTSCAAGESPEVTVNANEAAHLILGYGARSANSSLGKTNEASGTGFPNAFTVRSIAVYIDAAHAGTGAVTNEGVAPGTTVK